MTRRKLFGFAVLAVSVAGCAGMEGAVDAQGDGGLPVVPSGDDESPPPKPPRRESPAKPPPVAPPAKPPADEPDDGPVAPPDEPPPPGGVDACGGVTAEGNCRGAVALWCDGGRVRNIDCGEYGLACGFDDGMGRHTCVEGAPGVDPPPDDPGLPGDEDPPVDDPAPPGGAGCGDVDYLGACRGDVAVWCNDGRLEQVDCAEFGERCGFVDEETGYYCGDGGELPIDDDPPPDDDPPVVPPDDDPPPAEGCGDVDYLGVCDGDVAVWCVSGELRSADCAAQGATCGWIDDVTGNYCRAPGAEPPPAEGCGDVDYLGACEGDVAVWCVDGELRRADCAPLGQVCGWIGEQTGFYCQAEEPVPDAPAEPPPEEPPSAADECGGVDFYGACEGDVALWCEDGRLYAVDCAAQGLGCGWIDDETGFYCQ